MKKQQKLQLVNWWQPAWTFVLILYRPYFFSLSFFFVINCVVKTCISASHIKGLEINRSKPEQTCWKWCNLKLCWKLLFFAFFLSLGISQEEEDRKGGLCVGKGKYPIIACLGYRAVWLEGADFQKQQWGQALHRMRNSDMKHQSNSFQWLDFRLQYTQEIGAVGKSAHGDRTVSVNYEQWTFSSTCNSNQVEAFF